jgi:long-chain acyl-CoA synthetase
MMTNQPSLQVGQLLKGKTILLYGGTGFLGKVWMSLVLTHFPEVEHIYMVVRSRKNSDGSIRQTSEKRFWSEVATSGAFDPLRELYPQEQYTQFINDKVTPIDGDVKNPFGGISDELRNKMRSNVDVLVNSSGVVDFNPPLDKSLDVNAFGMQNLVSLAKDLGNIKFLHTSTCYVAGDRTGQVDEIHPLKFPFPKAEELDVKHWNPDQEIKECMEMVTHAKQRAKDAFRQSDFLDVAKTNLRKKGEPTRGRALDDELKRVERRFIEDQLVVEGTERAQFWGWHNIYTYTKSIGEQILCRSELPFSIVRPAVIESAVHFPKVGWNEGINTSAPLIYLINQGPLLVPTTKESVLDVIPVDLVAIGMVLSCAELLQDTHKSVYQYGTSATNPLSMYRLVELVSLHKRRRMRKEGKNPLINAVMQRIEATPVNVNTYWSRGPQIQATQVKKLESFLKPLEKGILSSLAKPARKSVKGLVKNLEITAKITDQFVPFTATHNYRFSTYNTKEAFERLSEDEQKKLPWNPLEIDWREYILDIHCPGLVENVFPLVEEKKNKKSKPLRSYDHLLDMLDEIAERYEHLPALMQIHDDGFSRVSYLEFRERAHSVALRLQESGVKPGDPVYLSGANHPNWSICYFGILVSGAVAVPLDVALTPVQAITIDTSAGAKIGIFDNEALLAFANELDVNVLDMAYMTETIKDAVNKTPQIEIQGESLASILYTSGTTGVPKGVMLSHGNFTSMLASLGKLFSITSEDRLLSVLPLHHTFEFSCGLLMPLSLGASIIYLDEVTGEQLSLGLREGQVTAMVGVPALWQLLERRIKSQIQEQGSLFEAILDGMLELNRRLGKNAKLDVGRLMFAPIHGKLGGNIKFLISGGAALPPDTQKFFSGLGLHLTEGYGLTEAAPVLTVSEGSPGAKVGTVGKTIPGVEIKILNPDDNGVGEVLAKGENVMMGYFNNDRATETAIDNDGWLYTGDMGRIDHKKRLFLVGRAKEIVVTSSGENIYLDDVENTLATIRLIKEYTLVGVKDPRGGERLGFLGVIDDESDDAKKMSRDELRAEAMDAIKKKINGLPPFQRPAVIHIVDADLPRTRTRKVQRKSSADILQKIIDATPTRLEAKLGTSGAITKAIASVAGISVDQISLSTQLQADLGFDSLMAVELASALSNLPKLGSPDPDDVSKCETVADIVQLVGQQVEERQKESDTRRTIPEPIAVPMKQALGWAQRSLYGAGLRTEVIGRDHIPQNQQLIVVSNHCSHLDMGLVKYALGPYGHKLVALAAKDYFFEGNPWMVAYFEQLTNLRPIDRRRGYSASLQQAKDIVNKGHVVLLFPEGTRRQDGILGDFKPLMGQLSLETLVDILPMHLGGTFEAMPKGAVVPQKRDLRVRIGPPVQVRQILPWVPDLNVPQKSRLITRLAQKSVAELQEDRVLTITKELVLSVVEELFPSNPKVVIVQRSTTEEILDELQRRYSPERVTKAITWALALNGKGGPRYTVEVQKEVIKIRKGKHDADFVIITTDAYLKRMVFEAFEPGIPDFMNGSIKCNNPMMLHEFSKIFNLKEPTQ